MVKSFNTWIAKLSNIRDEDSADISNWDQPLSRGAVVARTFVIALTFSSYIASFWIIQEGRNLLELDGINTPINFSHAIAALVTLQLIALTTTIYKEEGIISESAMVTLVASVPIFIASWSFYNLSSKEAETR